MLVTTWPAPARFSTSRRGVGTLLATAAVITFSLASAPPASAANATITGWHTVCANSLTQYNNGYVQTLDWNDYYNIVEFAGDGHVWGEGYHNGSSVGRYGWVYNGWFC